jgi:hypothetical protein
MQRRRGNIRSLLIMVLLKFSLDNYRRDYCDGFSRQSACSSMDSALSTPLGELHVSTCRLKRSCMHVASMVSEVQLRHCGCRRSLNFSNCIDNFCYHFGPFLLDPSQHYVLETTLSLLPHCSVCG